MGQHLLARLLELGRLGAERGLVRGLDEQTAGLLVLAGLVLAFFGGALLASRLLAPSDVGHSLILAVVWLGCVAGWDAACALAQLGGGPQAALLALAVGAMAWASHRLLGVSYQRGAAVVGVGWAFGGLIFLLLAQGLRLFSAI